MSQLDDFSSALSSLTSFATANDASTPIMTTAQDQFKVAQNFATTAFYNTTSLLNQLLYAAQQFNTIGTTVNLKQPPSIDLSVATGISVPLAPNIVIPSTPAIVFSYIEDPYTDQLLTDIKTWFVNFLENLNSGNSSTWGIGISQSAQNAMISMEIERDQIINQAAMDLVTDAWGERNLLLPDLGLIAGKNNVVIDYQNKRLDKSRQILFDNEDRAIKQVQFSIEQGNAYNKMLLEYATGSNDRKLRAAIASMQAGIDIYKAALDFAKTQVEIFKVQVDAYTSEVDIGIKSVDSQIEVYKAITTFNVEQAKLDLSQVELYIKELETKITINVQAIQGAATIAAHLAAGAMSSASASAHISASDSTSNSVSRGASFGAQETTIITS